MLRVLTLTESSLFTVLIAMPCDSNVAQRSTGTALSTSGRASIPDIMRSMAAA